MISPSSSSSRSGTLPTLTIAIHAVPGARGTEAAGAHGDALRVRLAAPPVDGKANAELIRWAAEAFGVARSRVELVRGTSSRVKRLAVQFDTAQALEQARQQAARWMGGSESFE